MADVCIRGEGVAHFDELNFFSFHAKRDRTLASGEAAAHDNDFVGNLVEIAVQLIDNDNLLSIHAFDRRNKRTGACGDDEGIRCFFLDVLRCYLGVEADFHTCISCETLVGLGQREHFPFKRQGNFAL